MRETQRLLQHDSFELLPYHELPDITHPSWNPSPLVIERYKPETRQTVVALGLKHLKEQPNPHVSTLREVSGMFMLTTYMDESPRVIINEGGGWPISDSLDLAYARYGEAGFLTTLAAQLAAQTNIDTELICGEPPKEGAPALLQEGFTKEEIACFIWERFLGQWDGRREYTLQEALYRKAALIGWKQDVFSISNLQSIYEHIYQRPFREDTKEFYLHETVGYMLPPTSSRIHQIAIAVNRIRDQHLARLILDQYKMGKSILVAFGWPHIRTLQPLLEGLGPEVFSPPPADMRDDRLLYI